MRAPEAWTIAGIRAAIRAGAVTPVEIVEETYRRLDALDDPAALIATIPIEIALAAAEALGTRDVDDLPLFGIPFVVKDNIDVAGVPTTAACASFAHTPAVSATVVERLVAAGAIPVAKANLDQFATGLDGTRSPFGVPRNALDAAFVPGGSSSGSAVVVARGVVPFALGTDTAGSGRVPASFNGLVGLKPTVGLVPTTGVVPAVAALDCVSVFAHTVDDSRVVAGIMAGADGAEPITWSTPASIAVPTDAGLESCDPGTLAAHRAAVARLAGLGHRIIEVDIEPLLAIGRLLYSRGPWLRERYEAFGAHIEAHPDTADPTVAELVLSSSVVDPAAVAAALDTLAALTPAAERVLASADALLLPVSPSMPTLRTGLADPIATSRHLGTFTNFVNLLGLCSIAVPGPHRAFGLPCGAMFIGPAGDDDALATIAASFHRPTDPLRPASPTTAGSTVELAVVGAHLAGLPLNHQLTDRGATFSRATTTSADYRLVALADSLPPNAGPARPGLIRVADGTGGRIALEVWTLTTDALGSFMTGVPAPLGIGTVRLRDGSSIAGFICEGIAAEGAVDLTEFGGWRAWFAEGCPVD
jgi:allophanate hydrolase